jgi:hypothetical protein
LNKIQKRNAEFQLWGVYIYEENIFFDSVAFFSIGRGKKENPGKHFLPPHPRVPELSFSFKLRR